MTRHIIFNLCVLGLQLGFTLLFNALEMPRCTLIANLIGMNLIVLALISMTIPKYREWWTKPLKEE